eukprot:TRINITY_DN906_c0_g1_i3.p1 TRINITY_DN906_c0_g1~~TRINITY_DN906_c0_g1_i3.p1  ORF type:complete len:871 (-),score=77.48 TRINITY_DN906_c0_g1_i3:104-2716(-)
MMSIHFLVGILFTCCNCFQLTVMHTGTLRGCYLPIDRNGNMCSVSQIDNTPWLCEGGIWHRAHKIEEIRNEVTNSLLIESGNFFQGTVFSLRNGGSAIFEFMNELKYDAISLGPRDFDMELLDPTSRGATLGGFIRNSNFSTVSSNMNTSLVPELSAIAPYYIATYPSGDRVGVVSHIAKDIKILSRGTPANLTIKSELSGIQFAVDSLINLGVNKIIYIANEQYDQFEYITNFVSQIPGIDIVVVGQERGYLQSSSTRTGYPYPIVASSPSGKPVLIVSSSRLGRYMGRLDATFDSNGILTNWTGDTIKLVANYSFSVSQTANGSKVTYIPSTPFTERIRSRVLTLWNDMQPFLAEKIGETNVMFNGSYTIVRFMECPLGNLVADALRYGTGAQIGTFNGGGMGGLVYPGNITIQDIYQLVQFANTALVIEISGKDIISALQNSVFRSDYELTNPSGAGTGRYLQFSGLKFSYNPSANSTLRPTIRNPNLLIPDRVVSVHVMNENGVYEVIDLKKNYSMAINDFLLNGGNDYEMFINCTVLPGTGVTVHEILMDYVRKFSPLNTVVEGRIMRVSDNPVDFFAVDVPPQPYWLPYDSGYSYFFLSFSSILLLLLLITLIMVQVYKDEAVIKSSSVVFLSVILSGLILVCMSIYFWFSEPTTGLCNARIWLLMIGFLISYGSMIIKNWRLAKIFGEHNLSNLMRPITDSRLLLYLCGVVGVGFIVLSLWVGVDPLHPSDVTNSLIEPGKLYFVSCKSESSLWIVVALIYSCGYLVFGLFISFKTRNVPSQFRESQHIAWVTYNLTLVSIIAIALAYILHDGTSVSVIFMGAVLIASLFTWAVMFVTKFVVIFSNKRHTTTQSTQNSFVSMT